MHLPFIHTDTLPSTTRSRKAILIAFALLVVLVVYRQPLLSGFTVTTGHELDGVIATSLIEHWWNVFQGGAYWETVNYFAPYEHTLGYNDGYLIFGILHSLFRSVGADPFLAAELALWVLRGVGFIAFWGLAHRCLRLPYWSSLVGAAIFSLSSSAFLQSQHVQLLTINLAPLMAWSMVSTWQRFYCRQTLQGILFAIATVLLYAMWLLTAFYMAWFFAFFSLTLLLVTSLLAMPVVYSAIKGCCSLYWGKRLLAVALLGVIAVVPFLWVYLPKVQETGGQPYEAVITFLLTPANLFNVGAENLVWGKLLALYETHYGLNPENNYELLVGFPPLFLLGSLAITTWLLFRHPRRHALWASMALSALVGLVLIVRVGDSSLWWGVWNYIPGANGLRAVSRYAIFLALPLCLLWSLALPSIKKHASLAVVVPLVALLVLEQISLENNAEVPRATYINDMREAQAPPASCRAFFVTQRRESDQHITTSTLFGDLYPHNVAAMLFAEWWNVRTLNGFSTFNPPGWNFAYLPEGSYRFRVRDYVVKHDMSEGLCAFDLSALTWNTAPFAPQTLQALEQVKDHAPPSNDQLDIELTHSDIHSADEHTWRFGLGIENVGDTALVVDQPSTINLGVRLYSQEDELITPDFIRQHITTLLPGEQIELPIDLPKAQVAGKRLKITLVQEGIAWLDEWAPPVVIEFSSND
ncbi:hypothetical protein ACGLWX_03215 [Halomonas sp. HMF6819]|uniref:hypothetical protein n=1 Tax=Halomonas sp. HMF6819 TaxID=3373085 RepID=UPI0037A0D868